MKTLVIHDSDEPTGESNVSCLSVPDDWNDEMLRKEYENWLHEPFVPNSKYVSFDEWLVSKGAVVATPDVVLVFNT